MVLQNSLHYRPAIFDKVLCSFPFFQMFALISSTAILNRRKFSECPTQIDVNGFLEALSTFSSVASSPFVAEPLCRKASPSGSPEPLSEAAKRLCTDQCAVVFKVHYSKCSEAGTDNRSLLEKLRHRTAHVETGISIFGTT